MSFKWFFVVHNQAKINDVLLTMAGSSASTPTHQQRQPSNNTKDIFT